MIPVEKETGGGDPSLYTMTEAARLKGVSSRTVSRAVRRGVLPICRQGRQGFIAADALATWHPKRRRAPRENRRDAGPTAEGARERVVLEQRVVTLALTAVRGVSLVNLRALSVGLTALVEDLAGRPDRHPGHEEDEAPPDLRSLETP